jgi:broad specificity phosphatase PhoE
MLYITYFVHGTTLDNEGGIASGWKDCALSEHGKRQASVLRDLTKGRQYCAVFCSDLKRSVDTAEAAFGGRFPIIQDDRLRECDYGDLSGLPHTFKANMQTYIDEPFPNGECYRDVEARVEAFLAEIQAQYAGKHIAVVAHQAPQLALDVLLAGKSWPQAIAEDWRNERAWRPGWEYTREMVGRQ